MREHDTSDGRTAEMPVFEADYFEVLGLPPLLSIDDSDLEKKYLALSRELHPDFHPAEDQVTVLARSATANNAYNTLRKTAGRARYWLAYIGEPLQDGGYGVPPVLAMRVFEVQEQLESLKVEGAGRKNIQKERESLVLEIEEQERALEELFAEWDAADPNKQQEHPEFVVRLKEKISHANYLRTLVRDIDRVLE